jgi:hypothetical protein
MVRHHLLVVASLGGRASGDALLVGNLAVVSIESCLQVPVEEVVAVEGTSADALG